MTRASTETRTSTAHGDAILSRIAEDQPVRGAELGVCRAVLSDHLLSARPMLELVLVDQYVAHDPGSEAHAWGLECNDPCMLLSQDQHDANRREAFCVVAKYGARTCWIMRDTVAAAQRIDDASLDFVFVDADHRKQSTIDDIRAWLPKIKPGGWIGGHDYNVPGMATGVADAIGYLLKTGELTGLQLDRFYTWFATPGSVQP